MSIMNGKPCTSRGVSTVWEGLCANLSSKDDKAAHCYLTIGAMQSIAYSGLDTDNLDLEVMLQHPLKMLLLAGMNFLVIGILIAGCVLFIVELVKHRETFRLGNTVPQVSGGKKALVYWTAPVTIVCVIVFLAMAIVNAIG